ncbi:hypothetical protein GDO86_002477 [Hymenochirus boettgeri]|uniref:RanBD1 domain-containing protein n=1 Tax=Hymenochirus boettgeri TaxID=247094 RepID=A0A8T2KQS3_9PIPI|nr:hypothetical protein GDO86_002477 [Hymenochirus boettgeri]KAG8456706.1 hypothetical protein GDO86_002477 [Hymenochirus boettgeri]
MRNQQPPAIRVSVLYPEIEPWCGGSTQSGVYQDKAGGSTQGPTGSMCVTVTERRRDLAGNHPTETDCSEKALLAEPVFVLEKKEGPVKRPATDLVLNAEQGVTVYTEKRERSSSFTSSSSSHTDNGVSEKRVRSSSFTFLPTFPPSQSGLRNNVFTPSSLLQEHPLTAATSRGKSATWKVIKPATLQAPKISLGQNGCEPATCQSADKTPCLDKSNSSLDNHSKIKFAPTCILDIKTKRNQPFVPVYKAVKNTSDFVFGENMEKRVMSPRRPLRSQTSISQGKWERASSHFVATQRNWPYQRQYGRTGTSLIESAAAYTSKPRIKYELDVMEIITGEESERNVLQVNCKLFVLNKESQMWVERGRGYLRLNDSVESVNGMFQSRIVMRNHGSLKLILNSKIFEQMKLERASRKSLRITAVDLTDNQLKFFLIQATVKDAGRLYAAIHHRLVAMRTSRQQMFNVVSVEADVPSWLINSDSEDEDEVASVHSISDHDQWIRRQPVLKS